MIRRLDVSGSVQRPWEAAVPAAAAGDLVEMLLCGASARTTRTRPMDVKFQPDWLKGVHVTAEK